MDILLLIHYITLTYVSSYYCIITGYSNIFRPISGDVKFYHLSCEYSVCYFFSVVDDARVI